MMLLNGIHSYIDTNKKFWFSLKEVCVKFDVNYDQMLKKLSDWQKKCIVSIDTEETIIFTNEVGLYQVAVFGKGKTSDELQEVLYDQINNIRTDLYQAYHPTTEKYFKYSDTNLKDKSDEVSYSNKKIVVKAMEKLDRILELLENNVQMKALEKQIDSLTVMLNNTMKENDRIKRKFKDYRDSIINRGRNLSEFESKEEESSCCCCTDKNPIETTTINSKEEFLEKVLNDKDIPEEIKYIAEQFKDAIQKSSDSDIKEKESCTCCKDTEKSNTKSDDIEQVTSLIGNLLKLYAADISKITNLIKPEK